MNRSRREAFLLWNLNYCEVQNIVLYYEPTAKLDSFLLASFFFNLSLSVLCTQHRMRYKYIINIHMFELLRQAKYHAKVINLKFFVKFSCDNSYF